MQPIKNDQDWKMIEIRKLPMIQYQNEIFLSQSRENITWWIWEAVYGGDWFTQKLEDILKVEINGLF